MPPPECPVCRDNYNSDANQPLLLPCSHTLCRSCVSRVVKSGKIRKCPGCTGSHDSVVAGQLNVNYSMLAVSCPPSSGATQTCTPQIQGSTIQVTLMTTDGMNTYSLKVFASITIGEMKAVIKALYGYEPDTTRLVAKGRVLRDQHKLTFYNIGQGSILHMSTT